MLGERGGAKNVGKTRALAIGNPRLVPTWSPDCPVFVPFAPSGEASGEKARRKEFYVKKINYKGRCEKRKVFKCEDVCRTYSKIQSAFVDLLEKDEDIVSFECNVRLKGVADDLYSTDIVARKIDDSLMVRECVWRINLNKPSYTKLLDISRNYWLSHGVKDWGIVIEKEALDESK